MQLVPAVSTGYSGYYDGELRQPYAGTQFQHDNMDRQIGRAFGGAGRRRNRAIVSALTGQAVGAAYSTTAYRLRYSNANVDHGRVITTEPVVQSGNTTAAQRDVMLGVLNEVAEVEFAAGYPRDAAGVGGGGKLGY